MTGKERIHINAIKEAFDYKQPRINTIDIKFGDTSFCVEVKKSLSLFETEEFVRDVLNMLFYDIEGNGDEEYYAALKKFVIDYNIIDYFTNIDLGDSYEEAWALITNTDIVRQVTEEIERDTLECLLSHANEMIEYKKKKLLHKRKIDEILKDAYISVGGIIERLGRMSPDEALAVIANKDPDTKEKVAEIAEILNQEKGSK